MAQYADDIIEGRCDNYGDYSDNYSSESRSSRISQRQKAWLDRQSLIRKGIAIDIKSGKSLNEARQSANAIYGKDWRVDYRLI